MQTRFLTFITSLLLPFFLLAQDAEKSAISNFLDSWHKAAAETDQKAYFDGIAEDGIYIGTDATEIWTKQEFYEWSKPYFDKGKAWSFTAIKRNIYLSDDRNFAWFDELLQFTGGVLRGSGVLCKKEGLWKIEQYVLSLPVPNAKFKEVIEVLNPESEDKLIEQK